MTLEHPKALIVTYLTTILAFIVIATRLLCRRFRGEKLQVYDKWMGAAAIPLLVRLAVEHVILVFGTNKMADPGNLSQREIEQRVIGSKLVLVCRAMSVCFLWTMKICILGFYMKLVANRNPYPRVINVFRWVVGLTFILVILSTFFECRPFRGYWELTPNPESQCARAPIQLLIMGISNILTDVVLIILPLPLIFKSKLQRKQKIELSTLFSVGFLVVVVTIIRIPILRLQIGTQEARSMWISVECFAACLVANAPTLYSSTRHTRESKVQKVDYSYGISENTRWRGRDRVGHDEFIVEKMTEISQEVDIVDFSITLEGSLRQGVETQAWGQPSSSLRR